MNFRESERVLSSSMPTDGHFIRASRVKVFLWNVGESGGKTKGALRWHQGNVKVCCDGVNKGYSA